MTLFKYDAVGRVIAVKDQEGYEVKYEYNADGNIIKIIGKNGNILHRTLDEAGQILEERLLNRDGGEIFRKYTYDMYDNKID